MNTTFTISLQEFLAHIDPKKTLNVQQVAEHLSLVAMLQTTKDLAVYLKLEPGSFSTFQEVAEKCTTPEQRKYLFEVLYRNLIAVKKDYIVTHVSALKRDMREQLYVDYPPLKEFMEHGSYL